MAELPPVTLIALRVLGAAVFLMVAMGARSEKLPRDGRTWRMLLLQAACNSIGAWTVLAWDQQYVDSGLASVLNTISPIFVFFTTILITRHETLSGRKPASKQNYTSRHHAGKLRTLSTEAAVRSVCGIR